MDGRRLDSLSRTLAHGSTRRQALRRGGALAAFGAALGFGSTKVATAQSGGLVCTLDFQGLNVTGPGAGSAIEAEVTLQMGDDGAIDQGELTIDGGDTFDLVGQASGRALNLRIEVQDGGIVTLSGTGEENLFDCSGEVRGTFTGPEPETIGSWVAVATGSSGRAGGSSGSASGSRGSGGSSNQPSGGGFGSGSGSGSTTPGLEGDDGEGFSEAPTCGANEVLCNNQCVSRVCPAAEEINQHTCECAPIAEIPGGGGSDDCASNEVRCGGRCVLAICGLGNVMNFDTCECEPGDGGQNGGDGGDVACLEDQIPCQGGCVDACLNGQEMDMDTCFCMGETPTGN